MNSTTPTQEDIWDPNARFSLSVREITSVSATFILSADPSLSEFSWDEEDDEDSANSNTRNADASSGSETTTRVIPDALAKGLSVLVNGQPWQRVLMRVDDSADEAIIIIYGLMPGRRYDIELGVAPGDEAIRGQVTTELNSHTDLQNGEGDSSQEEDDSTLAGSAGSSPSSSPAPAPLPPTVEERAQQLQQALNQLSEERATLAASLKTTRRDAQKADAALRADIEGLKRASEKQAAGEHRARQKILALQEMVKQATATTTSTEAETADIEGSLPGLKLSLQEREREHERARAEADKCRAERERAEADARRRTDASRSELSTLANRLDRLATRKDKLESGTIADLEEQLRQVREEIDRIEGDPFGYLDGLVEEDTHVPVEDGYEYGGPHGPLTYGSLRQAPPSARGPAMPGPIQRPQVPSMRATLTQQPLSPTNRLRGNANGRRPNVPPGTLPGSSAKPNPLSALRPSMGTTSSIPPSQPLNSTLSGRAPPFEPRRGGTATTLNPASTAFEPKSILVNPNRARAPVHTPATKTS